MLVGLLYHRVSAALGIAVPSLTHASADQHPAVSHPHCDSASDRSADLRSPRDSGDDDPAGSLFRRDSACPNPADGGEGRDSARWKCSFAGEHRDWWRWKCVFASMSRDSVRWKCVFAGPACRPGRRRGRREGPGFRDLTGVIAKNRVDLAVQSPRC